MSQQLEGPGSEDRLKTIQERFKRVGASKGWTGTLFLGLCVFAAVVLAGLAITLLKPPPPPVDLPPPPAPVAGLRPFDPYSIGFTRCSQAHAANVYAIPRGAPGYNTSLDPDRDGLACEAGEGD